MAIIILGNTDNSSFSESKRLKKNDLTYEKKFKVLL